MGTAMHQINVTMAHHYGWDFQLTEDVIKLMCEDKTKYINSAHKRADRHDKKKTAFRTREKVLKELAHVRQMEANGGGDDGICDPTTDGEAACQPYPVDELIIPATKGVETTSAATSKYNYKLTPRRGHHRHDTPPTKHKSSSSKHGKSQDSSPPRTEPEGSSDSDSDLDISRDSDSHTDGEDNPTAHRQHMEIQQRKYQHVQNPHRKTALNSTMPNQQS